MPPFVSQHFQVLLPHVRSGELLEMVFKYSYSFLYVNFVTHPVSSKSCCPVLSVQLVLHRSLN